MNDHIFYIVFFIFYLTNVSLGIKINHSKVSKTKKSNHQIISLKEKTKFHLAKLYLHRSKHLFRKLLDEEEKIKLLQNLNIKELTPDEIQKVDPLLIDKNLSLFISYLHNQKEIDVLKFILKIKPESLKRNMEAFYSLYPNIKEPLHQMHIIIYFGSIDLDFIKKQSNDVHKLLSMNEAPTLLAKWLKPLLLNPNLFQKYNHNFFYILSKTTDNTKLIIIKFITTSNPELIQSNSKKIFEIITNAFDENRDEASTSNNQDIRTNTLGHNVSPQLIIRYLHIYLDIIEKMDRTYHSKMIEFLISGHLITFIKSLDLDIKKNTINHLLKRFIKSKVGITIYTLKRFIEAYPNLIEENINYIFELLLEGTDETKAMTIGFIAIFNPALIQPNSQEIFETLTSLKNEELDKGSISMNQDKITETLGSNVSPLLTIQLLKLYLNIIEKMDPVYHSRMLEFLISDSLIRFIASLDENSKKKNIIFLLKQFIVSTLGPTPYVLRHLINTYPKLIEENINYIFQWLLEATDKTKLVIIDMIANSNQELIKSNSEQIYEVISTKDPRGYELDEDLSEDEDFVPTFVLENTPNYLNIMYKMDKYYQSRMLEYLIGDSLIDFLERTNSDRKNIIIDNIWLFFKKNDKAELTPLTFHYLIKANPNLSQENMEYVTNSLVIATDDVPFLMIDTIVASPKMILSINEKVIQVFQSLKYSEQVAILHTLLNHEGKFIVSNINIFFDIILTISDDANQIEQLEIFIKKNRKKIAESEDIKISKENKNKMWKLIKSSNNLPPLILAFFIKKGILQDKSTLYNNNDIFDIIDSAEFNEKIEIFKGLAFIDPKFIYFNLDKLLKIIFKINNNGHQIQLLESFLKVTFDTIKDETNDDKSKIIQKKNIEILTSEHITISEENKNDIWQLLKSSNKLWVYILPFYIKIELDFSKNNLLQQNEFLSKNVELYDIIKNAEFQDQKVLLEYGAVIAPEFIVYNLNKLFNMIFAINNNEHQIDLLSCMARTPTLDVLRKIENIISDEGINNIWHILKNMDEPLADIAVLFIMVGKYKLNNDIEIRKELKQILNIMDVDNYDKVMNEVMDDIPKDILETNENDKDCAICQEKIPSGVQFKWCSNDHGDNGFHSRCINNKSNNDRKRCAICRIEIDVKRQRTAL